MKMDHCGFQIRDMDKAIRFYIEKLSFTLNFRNINQEAQEESAFVSLGEARLELIRDLANEYQIKEITKPYCPHFCIEVKDLEIALNELIAKGVKILKGPLKIENEETWVYFSDEDNNVLEYIQWYNKK